MRTLLIVLAAVLASTVAGVGAAPAQKKPKPTGPITLEATPSPVLYKQLLTFSGRVEGAREGVTVTLQSASSAAGTFVDVATTKTTNAGRYTLGIRPARNRHYRAVAATTPAVQSATLRVKVRPVVGVRANDVTPAKGARVRFSGTVRPRHNGRTINLQRRSATGTWSTVKRSVLRARTASSSKYSLRYRIRATGVYRTKISAHGDHTTGLSREVTITVG